MIPMNNPQQYQVNQNQDDSNNYSDMVSPNLKARLGFEAVEEPLKYAVRTGMFSFASSSIIAPSMDNIHTMGENIQQGFSRVASSGFASDAQRFAMNITPSRMKDSFGVMFKAISTAAKHGR
jgi:hypothetical protein